MVFCEQPVSRTILKLFTGLGGEEVVNKKNFSFGCAELNLLLVP
jgi:hypothetical protein